MILGRSSCSLLCTLAFITFAAIAPVLAKAPAWVPSEGIGSVHMPISCLRVQAQFDRGLALLHSFWYDRALAVFDDAIATDPQCQIAYWGAAMTYNHPLWAPPTSDDVAHALSYIKRGNAATERSAREAAYFHSVTTLFGDGKPETKDQRDTQYMNEMAQVYASYPDDETALFYALSIEGSPRYYSDSARIEKAGSLAEMVHNHQPNHPGALHYTIHAYDTRGYEERALSAARAYAATAPAIPHALHMPSHTFLALGLWDESNSTNSRAWAASEQSVKDAGKPSYERDFHTLWFYMYGELQAGHYAKAKEIRDVALAQYRDVLRAYQTMPRQKADDTFDTWDLALQIADYAYETGDYSAVRVLTSDGLDGIGLASQIEVQALAALSAGDLTKVPGYRAKLDSLVASMKPPDYSPNAKRYASVALSEVDGLYALATGNEKAGLASLKQAADDESHLRDVYQPTLLPPAHELYATALFKRGQYAEAAQNYRIALQLTPNRPKAVFGLAKAATQLKDTATASAMMAQFSKMWSTADRSATASLAALKR